MIDRVGQQLGNYRLIRLIGTGGFAEVYLAEHQYLRTQAAIKVLHTQLTNDDLEYFLTEARTVAHLLHPHIVRVLEFGVEGTTPFLVMDYALNGTLRQFHPKGSQVPLVTVISYVKQLASALDYAHSQQVIHRDIKPENMLLGSTNAVLLGDFGIAQVAQSSRYQNVRDMAGTISYMAPEQIKSHPLAASDQYSLGIVVYEWLSGKRPFEGSFTEIAVKHALVTPPALRESVPYLSRAVERVVMTALAKEPSQRFATIQDFASALEQASHAAPDTPLPSTYLPQQADAPTFLNRPQGLIDAETVPSQPHEFPAIPREAATLLSTPNLFTPAEGAATMVSQPYQSSDTATPPRQIANVSSFSGIATDVNMMPSQRKPGSSFSGKTLLLITLLLLVVIGSTGVFYTIVATGKSGTKTATSVVVQGKATTKATPVQTVATVAEDTFQRADQTLWGNASDGKQWQGDANTSNAFFIDKKAGQVAHKKGSVNALLGPARNDGEVVFTGAINQFDNGVNIGIVLRWKDDQNWYKALIDGTKLNIIKRVNGNGPKTPLASLPFAAHGGTVYDMRFRVVNDTLLAKVWQHDQTEPQGWMLTVQDTSLTNGQGGLRFVLADTSVVTVNTFVEKNTHTVA